MINLQVNASPQAEEREGRKKERIEGGNSSREAHTEAGSDLVVLESTEGVCKFSMVMAGTGLHTSCGTVNTKIPLFTVRATGVKQGQPYSQNAVRGRPHQHRLRGPARLNTSLK